MIAILILAVIIVFPLPAVCLYRPLTDPIIERRVARRLAAEREVERVVARYRPGAPTARLHKPGWPIAEWTPLGWAGLEVAS